MTRWLLQFGYDGRAFAGWARQPGRTTVEGEILAGLERCAVTREASTSGLAVASRTDRGVSARANALTLNSPLPAAAVLRALNGIRPDIWFTAAREVDDSFRLRAATRREYRYLVPTDWRGTDRWEELLPMFRADRIDVRSLGRGLPPERPTWRTLETIEQRTGPEGSALRIVARGFVWGMVRKIVAALRGAGTGAISATSLQRALRGEARLTIPLAPPEPLVLWEVVYDRPWTDRVRRLSRNQDRYFVEEREGAEVRGRLLPVLRPDLAP